MTGQLLWITIAIGILLFISGFHLMRNNTITKIFKKIDTAAPQDTFAFAFLVEGIFAGTLIGMLMCNIIISDMHALPSEFGYAMPLVMGTVILFAWMLIVSTDRIFGFVGLGIGWSMGIGIVSDDWLLLIMALALLDMGIFYGYLYERRRKILVTM
ncbi:TPA: hypothetical protein DCZ39_00615 [Patescibacteria group bacterium]|nr:hypothetical protein [Candidatus Gracilibacteria bacterium]